MKALLKKDYGYDNMELVDMEEPGAGGNLVKIRPLYTGICGSDLHAFRGIYRSTTPPVVLGHEFSGIVVETGPGVTKTRPGDRVTSETTFATCGTCPSCLSKDYNLCSNRKGIGTQVNGAFAEYVLTREESVHRIPDNVSLLSAALSEPLACTCHAALEKSRIGEGEITAVFGPGTIGMLLALVAKAHKAFVILAGVDADRERFELAKKLGIDMVINQEKANIAEETARFTRGKGVDAAFECSGAVPALNAALNIVKKQGQIIQMGVFPKEWSEINTEAILQKEIAYIGSRSQKPSSWEKALTLMKEETVIPEEIVTKIVPLENWREGFDAALRGEGVKVVVKIQDE